MLTIRIHDLDPSTGALKVDLKSVLSALGPAVKSFVWRVCKVNFKGPKFDVVGNAAEMFEHSEKNGDLLPYSAISKLAHEDHQLIWAEIRGYKGGSTNDPEISIRAIDSSYFEIESADSDLIEKIASKFQDLQAVSDH
jgi:hypothetical protein